MSVHNRHVPHCLVAFLCFLSCVLCVGDARALSCESLVITADDMGVFDVDKDGYSDLLVAMKQDFGARVYLITNAAVAGYEVVSSNGNFYSISGALDEGTPLVACGSTNSLYIYTRSDVGEWSEHCVIPLGTNISRAMKTVVSDLDQDGDQDLVVAAEGSFTNGSGVGLLVVWDNVTNTVVQELETDFSNVVQNEGGGESTNYSTWVGNLVVGNMTTDSYPDIVVSGCSTCADDTAYVVIELLSSNGVDYARTSDNSIAAWGLDVGDFNGDSLLDLAATGPAKVYASYGDGYFIPIWFTVLDPAYSFGGNYDFGYAVKAMDWNRDGQDDILAGGVTKEVVALSCTPSTNYSSSVLTSVVDTVRLIEGDSTALWRWFAVSDDADVKFFYDRDVTVPVYRLYSYGASDSTYEHLWTVSEAEKDTLDSWPSWQYEEVAWYALTNQAGGSTPLYRLYASSVRQHHYTADPNEYNALNSNGTWVGEGVQYHVYSNSVDGTLPVYRFYHSNLALHHFTISEAERASITNNPEWGYKYEGIGFYVMPTNVCLSTVGTNVAAARFSQERGVDIVESSWDCLCPVDHDGDGLADTLEYDPSTGGWYAVGEAGSFVLWADWGLFDMCRVPGDFNGDGVGDMALYCEHTGKWYIVSVSGSVLAWGLSE